MATSALAAFDLEGVSAGTTDHSAGLDGRSKSMPKMWIPSCTILGIFLVISLNFSWWRWKDNRYPSRYWLNFDKHGVWESYTNYPRQWEAKNTMITLTCFLSQSDKRPDHLKRAMESLMKHVPLKYVNKFLVLNEFDPAERDWKKFVDENVDIPEDWKSTIEFRQKSESQKYQPQSLNIVMKALKENPEAKFWLQWEDSWVLTKPIPGQAWDLLETGMTAQVELDWVWRDHPCLDLGGIRVFQRMDDRMGKCKTTGTDPARWPFFALRPSLNKKAVMTQFRFNEDARRRNLAGFEFDWACEVYLAGHNKAVVQSGIAQRQQGHKSTSGHTAQKAQKGK